MLSTTTFINLTNRVTVSKPREPKWIVSLTCIRHAPMDKNNFSNPRMLYVRQMLFRVENYFRQCFSTAWVHKLRANKFRSVAPNIFSIIMANGFPLHTKMCISSHAPSRKLHVTVGFTCHSVTVGRRCATRFTTLFRRLECVSGCWIFGKFVGPAVG